VSKVITFTRIFPDYHLRKGEPTYFAEQILNNLIGQNLKCDVANLADKLNFNLLENFVLNCGSKAHTIRSGNDWKVGDKFAPFLWQGKPRASELISFAPDLEVKQIWTFDCDIHEVIRLDDSIIDREQEEIIAKNDGLSWLDFREWLVKPCSKNQAPFKGQIICWDNTITY